MLLQHPPTPQPPRMRFLSPTNPPAPSPAPLSHPSLSPFDVATLSLISLLLLLSLVSLLLLAILRRRPHLSPFTPLSPLRTTLVSLISIWAVHFVLLLPFFAPSDAYCKLHIILSLGIFEPAFLLALLALLELSVTKPKKPFRYILFPLIPTLALQIFFVVFFPSQGYSRHFPSAFLTSSERINDQTLRCTCPLFGTVVFVAFFIVYCMAFLVTYWRVINLVINKGTRARIHVLAMSLFVCISLQILLMTVSTFWRLDDVAYGFLEVGLFLVPSVCAVIGEGILVIKPIMDALGADNSGGRRP